MLHEPRRPRPLSCLPASALTCPVGHKVNHRRPALGSPSIPVQTFFFELFSAGHPYYDLPFAVLHIKPSLVHPSFFFKSAGSQSPALRAVLLAILLLCKHPPASFFLWYRSIENFLHCSLFFFELPWPWPSATMDDPPRTFSLAV